MKPKRTFRSFKKNGKERKDRNVLLKRTEAQPCQDPIWGIPWSNLRDPRIQSAGSWYPKWGILGNNLRDPRIQSEWFQDPIWEIPGSNLRDPRIQSEGSQDPIWGIPGSNQRYPRIQSEGSQDPISRIPFDPSLLLTAICYNMDTFKMMFLLDNGSWVG